MACEFDPRSGYLVLLGGVSKLPSNALRYVYLSLLGSKEVFFLGDVLIGLPPVCP